MEVKKFIKPKYSWRQYSRTRFMGNVRFNPANSDEIFYIDNTRGNSFDIWKQTLPGSYPIELTRSEKWTPKGFGVTKDGSKIFMVADFQGNELMQIWSIPSTGGLPVRLTKEDSKRYMPAQNGLLDNNSLVITTDSLGMTMDVAVLNIDNGELKQLTASDSNMFAAGVSPDLKKILIGESLSNTNNNLYVFDIDSSELTLLTPHEGEINYGFQGWAADSSGFYLTTNHEREYQAGAYFDLAKSSFEIILSPEWDVSQIQASKDGKWLVWIVNENGYNRIHLKDLVKNEEIDSNKFPQGLVEIQEFSEDSKYLAYNFTDSSKLSDAHILNLETFEEHVITKSMLGGIDSDDMIYPEDIKLKSLQPDELEFFAYLYKPKNLKPGEKVPIILSIHGGPEASERPIYMYNGLYQIFLSMGIGVLAPNIRGSTGYGKKFQKLIHRKWDDIYGDIKACAEYMKGLDWVDEDRIGVFGGSFGGYATLFAVTQLPEYWKLGIDLVGPSNLETFVKAVPPFWKPMMKDWIGDPIEDLDRLKEMSPIYFVDKIKADMLIGQGANDPRVVKAESDQMVEKMKEMGLYVEYYCYDDEGHGFLKETNRNDWRMKMLNFVSKRFFGQELEFNEMEF